MSNEHRSRGPLMVSIGERLTSEQIEELKSQAVSWTLTNISVVSLPL